MLEDGRQGYFRCRQIDKGTCAVFDGIGHQWIVLPELYIDRGGSRLTKLVIRESHRMVS